jgi:threonine dehydrogenase-like Zn-dependent dehydrogenase
MAAYSAQLRGASRVYIADRVPGRLEAADKMGCTSINLSTADAVDQIIEANGGMVDRAVDAVGGVPGCRSRGKARSSSDLIGLEAIWRGWIWSGFGWIWIGQARYFWIGLDSLVWMLLELRWFNLIRQLLGPRGGKKAECGKAAQ